MEFKQLQTFVEVVKCNSFTKAAERLFISQPTISAHIRMLEDEVHTRLLIRTTKNIEITPKGRELYEYAVNILDLRERMIRNCSEDSQKIIHLGASTIPSAYILPEILPEYGRLFPDTYFVIHQGDSQSVIDGLLDNIYDIGLIGMKCENETLTSIPFCKDHMVLITPVSEYFLSLKAQNPVPVTELLKQPVILREKGSGSKKSADRFLEIMGISESDLHITARINDQEAIKNLVAGGLGISFISQRAAHNFLEEKRILMFELPGETSIRDLYVVFQKNYILRNYVKDFVDFLQQHFH
jgi:DNA-binding transcriptional LysR family regulator